MSNEMEFVIGQEYVCRNGERVRCYSLRDYDAHDCDILPVLMLRGGCHPMWYTPDGSYTVGGLESPWDIVAPADRNGVL